RWVTRVAVDPTADSVAYVTFSGLKWRDPQPHIFRTTDYGQNWQDISANLPDAPINAIVIDPLNTEVIYVGTDVGPFVSTDAGGSWQALGVGMPAVSVYDLKIHPTQHFLVAGTHGRSMYVLNDLPTAVEAESVSPLAGDFTLLPNYPNPFNPETVVPFRLASRTEVTVAIYNALGQRVTTLVEGVLAAGRHEVRWNGTDRTGQPVPSGVYFARLVVKAHHIVQQSRPMLLVR
ncbi:MAG: T9SS C-terminal target domain-containing protein, partial [Calditrichaeota bacterium]